MTRPRPSPMAMRLAAWVLSGVAAETSRKAPADRLSGICGAAAGMAALPGGFQGMASAEEIARHLDAVSDWLAEEAGGGVEYT